MIKGVLVDKDGTLIDFFSVWPQLAKQVIPAFLEANGLNEEGLEEEILESIGIKGDKVDPHGAFAYKSYGEAAEDMCGVLTGHGILMTVYGIYRQIKDMFNDTMRNSKLEYKTFADLNNLMDELKKRNIFIGLATSDTEESAEKTLKDLGIYEKFDYIGADNENRKPKPNGEMMEEFMEKTGIKAEEIAVVGDTYNDMLFAVQNGATSIGVLSGVSTILDFEDMADYTINTVEELPALLDKINKK